MNQTKFWLVSYLVAMTLFAFSGGNALADEKLVLTMAGQDETVELSRIDR